MTNVQTKLQEIFTNINEYNCIVEYSMPKMNSDWNIDKFTIVLCDDQECKKYRSIKGIFTQDNTSKTFLDHIHDVFAPEDDTDTSSEYNESPFPKEDLDTENPYHYTLVLIAKVAEDTNLTDYVLLFDTEYTGTIKALVGEVEITRMPVAIVVSDNKKNDTLDFEKVFKVDNFTIKDEVLAKAFGFPMSK